MMNIALNQRKAFLIICMLMHMIKPLHAQWMNIGESQADFRRSVSGLIKIGDKLVNGGLSRNVGAMDSLIATIKSEYKQETIKKVPSDSILLVLLERIT